MFQRVISLVPGVLYEMVTCAQKQPHTQAPPTCEEKQCGEEPGYEATQKHKTMVMCSTYVCCLEVVLSNIDLHDMLYF